MSKSLKFVAAASFAICLFMGCKAVPPQTNAAPAQTKTIPPQTMVQITMEGNPEAQAALLKLAQQYPTITDPRPEPNISSCLSNPGRE